MKVAVFDTHRFERETLKQAADARGVQLTFFEPRLNESTACLAAGHEGVCSFVNDRLNAETLESLATSGVRLVALRSAGFNHVDLETASRLGIAVVRVPEYSPHSVAEHALAMILCLNRKLHRSYHRVKEGNFSLEGLVGFDLYGKTVGVVGTGRIGSAFAQAMLALGCRVLAYDRSPSGALLARGVKYVALDELYREAIILSLHVPLTPETRHLIDDAAISKMRPGVMIINTGRGALIDTAALIRGLKTGQIGFAGLDVYEEEESVFFQDLSDQVIQDDLLARLLTFPNVLLTSHQGFLTRDALKNIADTTFQNVHDFESGKPLVNEVKSEKHFRKKI